MKYNNTTITILIAIVIAVGVMGFFYSRGIISRSDKPDTVGTITEKEYGQTVTEHVYSQIVRNDLRGKLYETEE